MLFTFTLAIGYSRGAYQIRVIAGMIDRVRSSRCGVSLPTSSVTDTIIELAVLNFQVGLLHKGNNNQIPLYVLTKMVISVWLRVVQCI